jgi:hypothetical protein
LSPKIVGFYENMAKVTPGVTLVNVIVFKRLDYCKLTFRADVAGIIKVKQPNTEILRK